MQEDSLTTPNPTASVVKSHDESAALRWKKGELIGCGAYGRVYVGMNLDTGELLAVKQVSIAANHGSRDKAQAQIRELEEEVKLLRNLSHQNIVRYLGTAREEEALNILLEFVPGGSISSLLGKFGSFTEPVIRKYTKQLLQGLVYLHSNGIMHRDIKGANILVDNKGCIKLADFGASKKVVELATISGAKSMKGTPYWMAPEVIRQTGHGLSADIWSVGCTVIEMATGKPPWSQQFQEVAALFHIGTTKSHPPIPDHLSPEAKDFLLKCLKKEPNLRPSASELVKHPFILGSYRDIHPLVRSSMLRSSTLVADQPQTSEANSSGFGVDKSNQINDRSRMSLVRVSAFGSDRNRFSFMRSSSVRPDRENTQLRSSALDSSLNLLRQSTSFLRNSLNFNSFLNATKSIQDMPNLGSVRSSIGKTFSVRQSFAKEVGLRNQSPHLSTFDEDMNCSVRLDSVGMDFPSKFVQSFNPMSEPLDEEDWGYRLKELGESKTAPVENDKHMMYDQANAPNYQNGFSFRCARLPCEDDDEVTESKIRAFLDEKALELKKLQTPLYEEFYNTMNAAIEPEDDRVCESGSPLTGAKCSSHSKSSNGEQPKRVSDVSVSSCSPARAASSNINPLNEISSPKLNEWKGMQEAQQGPSTPSSFSERQRLWKEELDQELERKREELRKRTAANGGKILSPKFKLLQRQKDRWGCTASKN